MKNLPSVKKFRAWLEAKQPSDIIGRRKRPRDCPWHRFLTDQGYEDVIVEKNYVSFRTGSFTFENRLHTQSRTSFIRAIDNYRFYHITRNISEDATTDDVTAAEALAVLDELHYH
jgi:hypothetical protein